MAYQFSYLPRFMQNFANLDPISQKSVRKAVEILAENPKHPSLRAKRVQGTDRVFEASANMDIRLIWQYESENVILLRNCGHHDKALKNP